MAAIDTVVLDVGNVLIEWDPRRLYRTLFADEAAMERFLADVCTPEWLGRIDRGEPFADAVADLTQKFPEHAEQIAAYHHRWFDTIGQPIEGTIDLLRDLRAAGVPVYGLTNYSAETWAPSCERYPFLREFTGVVVSAHEQLTKPDPRIYARLTDRFGLRPQQLLFADDREDNVAAARAAGWNAVVFTTPEALRATVVAEGLLPC